MPNEAVDLAAKLSQFSDHWSPQVVARLNDYEIKLVRLQGEFVWHTHDDTDELFLVIDGTLNIGLRDGDVTLRPGADASAVQRRATHHHDPVPRPASGGLAVYRWSQLTLTRRAAVDDPLS